MFKINNKKHKKYYGFTLVELIIVITILAILATISFVSFSGYTSKSRDSNRLFSLKEISKALEIQKEMTGNYPQPDDIYAYGGIPSLDETLFSVGLIGKNVSNYIKLGSIPLDPKTGNEYLYGLTRDNKNFQIAGTLENLQSSIIVPVTYADAGMQAVVEGNYKGVIKFSTGSSNYIGNIPSIIFSRTGTYDELRTFVINKGKNLPYSVDGEKLGIGLTPSEVLKELHNKDSLTLTGVIITNPKSEEEIIKISDELGVSDVIIADSLGNKEYASSGGSSGGGVSKPFECGDNLSVTVGGINYTYTTKLVEGTGGYSKCWTSQNMRHGIKLNGNVNPTDENIIEKWCYDDLDSNCDTYGALYNWSEAMGLPQSCISSNCSQPEDITKSVCGALGEGWKLPSKTDVNELISAGATGWTGNKFYGLVNSLPGWSALGLFGRLNTDAYYNLSTQLNGFNNQYEGFNSNVNQSINSIWFIPKNYGASVICIKE